MPRNTFGASRSGARVAAGCHGRVPPVLREITHRAWAAVACAWRRRGEMGAESTFRTLKNYPGPKNIRPEGSHLTVRMPYAILDVSS